MLVEPGHESAPVFYQGSHPGSGQPGRTSGTPVDREAPATGGRCPAISAKVVAAMIAGRRSGPPDPPPRAGLLLGVGRPNRGSGRPPGPRVWPGFRGPAGISPASTDRRRGWPARHLLTGPQAPGRPVLLLVPAPQEVRPSRCDPPAEFDDRQQRDPHPLSRPGSQLAGRRLMGRPAPPPLRARFSTAASDGRSSRWGARG